MEECFDLNSWLSFTYNGPFQVFRHRVLSTISCVVIKTKQRATMSTTSMVTIKVQLHLISHEMNLNIITYICRIRIPNIQNKLLFSFRFSTQSDQRVCTIMRKITWTKIWIHLWNIIDHGRNWSCYCVLGVNE